jgi:hypothetical protein
MYFAKFFVELIKRPTHLRAGPKDVVHQGRNSLSNFCVQILCICIFINELFLLYGALQFMLI